MGISGCSGASDVLETLLIPGTFFMSATGPTVGGDIVPRNLAENVEDDTYCGREEPMECNTIDKDMATGTVVLGIIFHATGVTYEVCEYGTSIGRTISNLDLLTVVEVDAVTETTAGFEHAMGSLCTKLGIG